MNDLISILKDRKTYLENVIEETSLRLAAAPPGSLRCARKGKSFQYYCRADAKDTNGRYICKENDLLIRELAQKDYDAKVIRAARQEIAGISRLFSSFPSKSPEDIYSSLSPVRQKLVKPICPTDEQYIEKWMASSYVKKPFREDTPEYYTAKGERVRSKTEILIADTLFRMNIPYQYEFPLLLDDGRIIIHPDFHTLNVRTRKSYYWEHFGMMDDPDYCRKAIARIDLLQRNGLFPGRDLIFTYETLTRPVNTRTIEKMIKVYLL